MRIKQEFDKDFFEEVYDKYNNNQIQGSLLD